MSSISERLAKLQQRATQEPETFEFDAGNSIAGQVVEVAMREGYEGVPYPAVTVETEDGTYVLLHLFHSVAKAKALELGISAGDLIAATYLGEQAPKRNPKGKKYHAWTIVVDASDRKASAPAAVTSEWTADGDAPPFGADHSTNPFG